MSNPRQLRRWLRGYLKQDRVILIIALVCAIGVALTSLAVAYLLKPYLDAASKGAVNAHALKQISFISLEVVGLYVLRGLFTYFETIFFAEAGLRLAMRLRNDIYEHLQGLSLGYFNKQRTGALMSTINNDVPLLQSVLTSMKDMATAPFLVVGGLIVIFKISWHLSLGAIVCVPLMALTIGWFTRKIRQITTTTQDKLSDVNALMEESLSGVRIIQSFTAEKQTVSRFRGENLSAMELTMSGVRQFAKIKPLTDIIGAVGVALALWVAGAVVVEGRLTLGDLGKFIFTLNQIAVGIGGLGAAKVSWEQIHAAGGRIRENVLDVDSDIKDAPDAVALGTVEGRVEFRDVAFAYNANTPVLKNVSFTMTPGEVVAVVAPSGAGKSTIADLLARFYDPTAGEVLVDGHDIRHVKLESLRRQIGIVPQETVLFVGTIRDNIVFGNPSATDAMVEAAARAANAHDFISDPRILPEGYATVVGERGKQLSGGQRQRIAIARALLKDPRILILDEATSSLDAESEILVQEALDELTQRRTTLVIAHRLSTIINAHKILVLQDGRIAETGTHAELIRKPNGLYARYYETHSRWEDEPSPSPTAASAS